MKKNKTDLFDIVNLLLLLAVAFVTLYPFLYVVFASLSDPIALMSNSAGGIFPGRLRKGVPESVHIPGLF